MDKPLAERGDRRGNRAAIFTDFWLEDRDGQRITEVIVGQDVKFCLEYRSNRSLDRVNVAFELAEVVGEALIHCDTQHTDFDCPAVPGAGVFRCEIKRFALRPGQYIGQIFMGVGRETIDDIEAAFKIDVVEGDFHGNGRLLHEGQFLVGQLWALHELDSLVPRSVGS